MSSGACDAAMPTRCEHVSLRNCASAVRRRSVAAAHVGAVLTRHYPSSGVPGQGFIGPGIGASGGV